MNEDKVKKIIQEMFSRNYTAGNTKVPPHTHNTIDNLPVSYKSLTDKPTIPTVGDILSKIPAPSGGGGSLEVTDSITDVTGVTKMDFPAGSLTEISPTEVSISVSATPAGSDTQIQYNSGGSAFGASSNFTYAQHFSFITATYTVVIGATNFYQQNGPGADYMFHIETINQVFANGQGGGLYIKTGAGGSSSGKSCSYSLSNFSISWLGTNPSPIFILGSPYSSSSCISLTKQTNALCNC